MKEGRVSEQGTYAELLMKKGDFAQFLIEYMSEHEGYELSREDKSQAQTVVSEETLMRQVSQLTTQERHSMSRLCPAEEPVTTTWKMAANQPRDGGNVNANSVAKLVVAEKAETGGVQYAVYLWYMRNLGWSPSLVIIMAIIY